MNETEMRIMKNSILADLRNLLDRISNMPKSLVCTNETGIKNSIANINTMLDFPDDNIAMCPHCGSVCKSNGFHSVGITDDNESVNFESVPAFNCSVCSKTFNELREYP